MICLASRPSLADYYRDTYLPLRLIGRSPRTREAYKTALAFWDRFAGSTPLEMIDTRLVARWAESLLPTRSPASVNCYVRHVMAILRCAAEEDDVAAPPKWRKLREPKRVPLALTVEEFAEVLKAADRRTGLIGGLPAGLWWRSLLMVGWETGLRATALLSIATADVIWESGGLLCQAEQQKDLEAQWFLLPAHTLAAIREIFAADRQLLWPRDVTNATIGRWFRQILDASGIHAPKGCGMCFHRLRRSKASYTKAAGGDATRALGHSASSVTQRYYDPRIVRPSNPVFMPMPTVLS